MKRNGILGRFLLRLVLLGTLLLGNLPMNTFAASRDAPVIQSTQTNAVQILTQATEQVAGTTERLIATLTPLAAGANESEDVVVVLSRSAQALAKAANLLVQAGAASPDAQATLERTAEAYSSAVAGMLLALEGAVGLIKTANSKGTVSSQVAEALTSAIDSLSSAVDESRSIALGLAESAASGSEETGFTGTLLLSATRVLSLSADALMALLKMLVDTADMDPFAVVPEPQLCQEQSPVLTPLSEAGEPSPNPELGDDVLSAERIYRNEQGQLFRITVSSRSAEALQEYLANVQVCFEALTYADETNPAPVEPVEELPASDIQSNEEFIQSILFNPDSEGLQAGILVEIEWLDRNNALPAADNDDLPDLTANIDIGPNQVTAGEEIGVVLVAFNEGNASAPGSSDPNGLTGYTLDLILSTDEDVPSYRTPITDSFQEDMRLDGGWVTDTPTLLPGESNTETVEVRLPENLPSGDYLLCARVDAGNFVAELDETNNARCLRLIVEGTDEPQPDPIPLAARHIVIHFYIDPPINANQPHGYVAKQQESARVKIKATSGEATVSLWQTDPFISVGSSTVSAPSSSGWIKGQADEITTFDTGVTGRQDGSDYDMYGGWTCNWGCE